MGDEDAEKALHQRFFLINAALTSLTAEGRYGEALAQLATRATIVCSWSSNRSVRVSSRRRVDGT